MENLSSYLLKNCSLQTNSPESKEIQYLLKNIVNEFPNRKIIVTILNEKNVQNIENLLIVFNNLIEIEEVSLIIIEDQRSKMKPIQRMEISKALEFIRNKHGKSSISLKTPTTNLQYFTLLSSANLGIFLTDFAINSKEEIDFVSVNCSHFISEINSNTMIKGIKINSNNHKDFLESIKKCLSESSSSNHQENLEIIYSLQKNDFISEITMKEEKLEKKIPPLLNNENLIEKFKKAKSKVLVLDYDGTISEIVDKPGDAKPTKEISKLLDNLASIPNCELVICTGRSKKIIDEWIENKKITIFAEHTAFKRKNGIWESRKLDLSWMKETVEIMQEFQKTAPGSYIEKKNTAIVFHYRLVNPIIADRQAEECRKLLVSSIGEKANVKIGKCILEVNCKGIEKDFALKEFIDKEFRLCAGDDTTDEMMFRIREFDSILVGKKESYAKFRIDSPKELRIFLNRLL